LRVCGAFLMCFQGFLEWSLSISEMSAGAAAEASIKTLEGVEERLISLLEIASGSAASLASGEPAQLAQVSQQATAFAKTLAEVKATLTEEIEKAAAAARAQ